MQNELQQNNENIQAVNGLQIAISILEKYPQDKRERILDKISKIDPRISLRYKEEHLSFDDIKDLDERSMQYIVTQANQKDIALSLIYAKEEIKNYFFGNMSERKMQMVKDDIDYLKSLATESQIFEAQTNLLILIDNLRKQGTAKLKPNSSLGITV